MIDNSFKLKFKFALSMVFICCLKQTVFAQDSSLRDFSGLDQRRSTSEQEQKYTPLEEPLFALENPIFEGDSLARPLTPVPKLQPKRFFDAGDLRDPFLLLSGYHDDRFKLIQPGETLDGERFYSYSKSQSFAEHNYRDSGFEINDVFGRVTVSDSKERCMKCHYGIEEIGKNHRFPCTRCHGGNGRTLSRKKAHLKMVSNPSDLRHADKYCGKCHADQVAKVKASQMATAKGQINFTRYAWGAQGLEEPLFSLLPTEEERLFPKHPTLNMETEEGQEILNQSFSESRSEPTVDRYLRESCLRCHLQAPAPRRPGDYRSTGCAACHMIYTNDGRTMTRDRAIQNRQKARVREEKKLFSGEFSANGLKNKRGYPVVHKFTTAIPSVQCEHCHHLNGPGNEYEGRFMRPARNRLAGQKIDSAQPMLYGARHDFLVPDIHREKGMHCIDCHGQGELKAAGPGAGFIHSTIRVQCENCHGTSQQAPPEFLLVESLQKTKDALKSASLNPNLARKIKPGMVVMTDPKGTPLYHIKKETTGWVLISKATGKKHKIPILAELPKISAHQLKAHMDQVECSACHAAWAANEWGRHVIYEDEPDWQRWQNWGFSDPSLQNLFLKHLAGEEENENGESLNWLTVRETSNGIEGENQKGVWLNVISEPDWKTLLLGKNNRGKYSIMKPRYQYWYSRKITNISAAGARPPMTKDGRPGLFVVPYSPHTIRPTARSCESCHGNEKALGLGDPKRKRISDGSEFLRMLKSGEPFSPDFQLFQMLALDGQPLQSVWPPGEARFLNPEEILGMDGNSDRYRAYRYFSLRERGFPRLLARESFQQDWKRQARRAKEGLKRRDEDFYYDAEQREIFQNKIDSYLEEPQSEAVEPLTQEPFGHNSNEGAIPSLPVVPD